jgi:hypothetical protein
MDRITKLDMALKLALKMLILYEPTDSKAVSKKFVALAAISANIDNEECIEIIEMALNEEGK